ncbi:MAG: aminoglycoside phosphotransferase family protein [Acidimicrobiia bacterium]|nr:aminoglycoside phosphotransferase family protein [Acidimicrobiia bacterium]
MVDEGMPGSDAVAAAAHFAVVDSVTSVEAHPAGHINDAYLVSTDRRRYLLQRLNPSVFPDTDAVMANVIAITNHLHAKGEPTLTLVPTDTGGLSWRDGTGVAWRMYDYIEARRPLEVRSPDDAAVVGRAFGRFHRLAADLDPTSLKVSLPGFHDPARRRAQLERAASTDAHGRLADASELVDALLAHSVPTLEGLPVRVAHNDAKAANLLVDGAGAGPPLVVDLDTVMAGSVLWDVGDMVRSSTGTPNEANAAVVFEVERYEAVVAAWLEEVEELLTAPERDAAPNAGPVVTFEQSVRFLTDHLLGDVYFRVSRPGENLDRARNQWQLLRSMETGIGSG